MTEFQIFQLVRDAYLSRLDPKSRTDIFAQAHARTVATSLGVAYVDAVALTNKIKLEYGPKKA